MPGKSTMKQVAKDKREGKAVSTQAGEFIREEIDHIRDGKHGARSAKQAIAIGLSKARRAGVKLRAPAKAPARVKRQAARDAARRAHPKKASATRSRATIKELKREPQRAASHQALSRQAHHAAGKRTAADRSASAKKAAKTREKNEPRA